MRYLILFLLTTTAAPGLAQSASVRLQPTRMSGAIQVGDTLSFEVIADLGDLRASGVALQIRMPARGLVVPGTHSGDPRPFRAGALFAGAVEFANAYIPEVEALGLPDGEALLTYAVVLGPGSTEERSRSGIGTIAAFDLVCTAPLEAARLSLFSNQVHESQVVLADGRSSRPLRPVGDVQFSVVEAVAKPVGGSWAALKSRHTP